MGVGGQRHAPPAFTPGKEPVPILQEAGSSPGPVWIGAENIASPGFDPRTVQPVGSRYTEYATRPTVKQIKLSNVQDTKICFWLLRIYLFSPNCTYISEHLCY